MGNIDALRENLPPSVTVHEYPNGYVEVKSYLNEFIAGCYIIAGFNGGVRSLYGPDDLDPGVRGLKTAADAYHQSL
ncbi:hypothetical protein NBRC116590_02480 [Pelagimonas sp. KU-00592-HH]|uniref:hypothetical protein n=1 Tax=Pelagimonas sp. KU-00592-HH TaxID=3127651 RepID=UPI00310842EF